MSFNFNRIYLIILLITSAIKGIFINPSQRYTFLEHSYKTHKSSNTSLWAFAPLRDISLRYIMIAFRVWHFSSRRLFDFTLSCPQSLFFSAFSYVILMTPSRAASLVHFKIIRKRAAIHGLQNEEHCRVIALQNVKLFSKGSYTNGWRTAKTSKE